MSRAPQAIEGFVAKDLELRQAAGKLVVEVSVPVTPQKQDESGKWVDNGDTVWYRATFWEGHAEAVADTIRKGSLVLLTGTGIKVDMWTSGDKSGVNLVVTNPQIAAIVRRPKRGEVRPQQGNEDAWASSAPAEPSGDAWNSPANYPDDSPF